VSVSPTDPSAPPTGRRRSLLRSTRFWSGVGAVLGVGATLWATLVGQTVPELLRDENAPLVEFRAKIDRICDAQGRPLRQARDAQEQTVSRLSASITELQTALAATLAPPQYTDEFAGLQRNWDEYQAGLDGVNIGRFTLAGADDPDYVGRAIDRANTAALQVSRYARRMDARACADLGSAAWRYLGYVRGAA
jgi:hypothetical protein